MVLAGSEHVYLSTGADQETYWCQSRQASRVMELPDGGPASTSRLSSDARAASAACWRPRIAFRYAELARRNAVISYH